MQSASTSTVDSDSAFAVSRELLALGMPQDAIPSIADVTVPIENGSRDVVTTRSTAEGKVPFNGHAPVNVGNGRTLSEIRATIAFVGTNTPRFVYLPAPDASSQETIAPVVNKSNVIGMM